MASTHDSTIDQGEASRYRARVEALCVGHRGSGTGRERAAAELLKGWLSEIGVEARLEEFEGSHSWGARYVVHMLIAMAGAALLPWVPWASLLLACLALASLWLDDQFLKPNLASWAARAPSQNVVGSVCGAGEIKRRILLCGHYDTQRTGWMWNETVIQNSFKAEWIPVLLRSQFLPVILGLFVQIGAGAGLLLGLHLPALWVMVGLLTIDLVAFVLVAQWTWGPFVPGAADNASGAVAVLSLVERFISEPLDGVELTVLLPGCEETGLLGAAAWADSHKEMRDRITFLNLDGVGMGMPRYFVREWPVAGFPLAYPADLVGMAAEVAGEMKLSPATVEQPGPTDGLALLVRGFKGLTIMGARPDGSMPHYHQMTDTPENMDFEGALVGVEFGWELVKRMATEAVHTDA